MSDVLGTTLPPSYMVRPVEARDVKAGISFLPRLLLTPPSAFPRLLPLPKRSGRRKRFTCQAPPDRCEADEHPVRVCVRDSLCPIVRRVVASRYTYPLNVPLRKSSFSLASKPSIGFSDGGFGDLGSAFANVVVTSFFHFPSPRNPRDKTASARPCCRCTTLDASPVPTRPLCSFLSLALLLRPTVLSISCWTLTFASFSLRFVTTLLF